MQLLELKLWYNRYQHFWPQWKIYKHCGLELRDVKNIELLRDNNFRIDTNLLEKFHTKEEIRQQLVIPLVIKLQANYLEYKEWVSVKFLLSLVKYGSNYGVQEFFDMPIDNLPVNNQVKRLLKSFPCNSINEMNKTFKEEDFMTEPLFSKLLKFKDFINNAPNKELFVLDEVLSVTRRN